MSSNLKKIIAITTVGVVLFIACYFFLTRSVIDSYRSHKQEYSQKQEDLLSVLDKIDILQKINKNHTDFAKKTDEVNTLWPDNTDVSKFIVQTEDLGKQQNFVIQNFSIQQKQATQKSSASDDSSSDSKATTDSTPTKKSADITQYSFNVSTPFDTALNIVKSMETLVRFNTVNKLTIDSKEDNLVDISFTGTLYYGK